MNNKPKARKIFCLLGTLWISLLVFACNKDQSPQTPRIEINTQTQAEEPAVTTSGEALTRLQEGNERFAAGSPRHEHASVARRKELVAGQNPFATILSCSDSRVPTEIVFDQGLGDLFVVRVAGNFPSPDDLGSIEYAVDHLHTPLVVVLGHESCGAITAALGPTAERKKEGKEIQELLAPLLQSLKDIDPKLNTAERVSRGVEANVRASVLKLENTPDLKGSITAGHLKIVGAVYELETGRIRILN